MTLAGDASEQTLNWRRGNAFADLCNKQSLSLTIRSSSSTLTNISPPLTVAVYFQSPTQYYPTPPTRPIHSRVTCKVATRLASLLYLQDGCRTCRCKSLPFIAASNPQHHRSTQSPCSSSTSRPRWASSGRYNSLTDQTARNALRK